MLSLLTFFFNDPATTVIYTYGHTLSLHDSLPILLRPHHHGSHGNDNHDARNAVPSTSHSSTSVPQLTLPDQSCVILSQQPQDCEAAVRRVRVELTKTGDNFVGFDCEWAVPLRAGGSPIALMQLYTATGVVA